MDPTYQDDQRYTQQNATMQPMQMSPPAPKGGLMDYVRNNKITVLIVIVIIIALLWWFCFRSKKDSTVTITTPSGVATKTGNITVTKSRGTMY